MIDYLRTVNTLHDTDKINTEFVSLVKTKLRQLISFFQYMQLETTQHFSKDYSFSKQQRNDNFSPYFDGETMLCLVKAARYLGDDYADLIPLIERTAPIIMKQNTVDEWIQSGFHVQNGLPKNYDSPITKGFYQWSSMFATEYYHAKWTNYEMFGDYTVSLAYWIITVHDILHKSRNTGYAYEGIISAYQIAKERKHDQALKVIEDTIDRGLYALTTWQVGGPLAFENDFLVDNPTTEQVAIGGILSSKRLSEIRIDTTQHQMHAVAMALETIY